MRDKQVTMVRRSHDKQKQGQSTFLFSFQTTQRREEENKETGRKEVREGVREGGQRPSPSKFGKQKEDQLISIRLMTHKKRLN